MNRFSRLALVSALTSFGLWRLVPGTRPSSRVQEWMRVKYFHEPGIKDNLVRNSARGPQFG